MNKKQLISIIRTEVLLAKSSPERKGYIAGLEEAINIIDGFSDEPEQPVIPQFVAEYIEFKKKNNFHVYGAMRVIEDHYDKRVPEWFYEGNVENFVRAWLDGYTVEEEAKYTVKVKGDFGQYLGKYYLNNEKLTPQFIRTQKHEGSVFTKAELEETGFGWVFDCPGIEIEEVE
jgi:hypothetical protein